jgi:hypothetical protein
MRSSFALLLLAACAFSSHAALRRGTGVEKSEIKKKLAEVQKDSLVKEDEGFWNRFVEEVNDSVTPRPTPPPAGPESCAGEVSLDWHVLPWKQVM